MMAHLTNDPSFWVGFWALVGMLFTALATLLGLLIAWAKAKTAEIEARDAKAGLVVTAKSLDRVEQAAGNVAAQVSTHSAQIAALQAQGSVAPQAAESVAQTAAQMVALGAQQAAAQIAAQAQSPTSQSAAEPPAWQSSTVRYAAPTPAPAAASQEPPAAGTPGATPA